MSNTFYKDLKSIDFFSEITNKANYTQLPQDWWIIITDIKNSTLAITEGKYKEVNLIAASCIMATLNLAKEDEIAFVFGGDGATLLIPSSFLSDTKSAMIATKELARKSFNLDLRIGAISVKELSDKGYFISVAKLKISENYFQACFIGGGISLAENLIKNDKENKYSFEFENGKADFSGLECRWQDIKTPYNETINLIVKSLNSNEDLNLKKYDQVINKIETIYGSYDQRNPIKSNNIFLSLNPIKLSGEGKIRGGKTFLSKISYTLKTYFYNLLGIFLINNKIKIKDLDYSLIKEIVSRSTDSEKFDDTLKMVLTGDKHQREELEKYLNKEYIDENIVYGIHITDRVIMTCLVFERNGRQVHFIDGADGGYALAAKELKAKLKKKFK